MRYDMKEERESQQLTQDKSLTHVGSGVGDGLGPPLGPGLKTMKR